MDKSPKQYIRIIHIVSNFENFNKGYVFWGFEEEDGCIREMHNGVIHERKNVEEYLSISEPEVTFTPIPVPAYNPLEDMDNNLLLKILIKTHNKHQGTPEYESMIKGVREEILYRMGESE